MYDEQAREIRKNYLSVGRFAMAAQLTRKAMRLYDEQGILVPAFVDPDSGYRYYNPAQLETARTIRLLREMEMSLADIGRVLAAPNEAEAIELVIEHRRLFDAKAEQMRRASYRVFASIRKEHEPMSTDITTKSFPACHAFGIMKNITVPAFHHFIPQALEQLHTYIQESGASVAGDPLCFYHGPVNENDDGPIEICWPATGDLKPSGEIIVREIPAHQAACSHAVDEQAKYPSILNVWSGVVEWVQNSEHKLSEETVACYEIWPADRSIIVAMPFDD